MSPLAIMVDQYLANLRQAVTQFLRGADLRRCPEAGEVARIPIELAWWTAERKVACAIRVAHDALAEMHFTFDVGYSTGREPDHDFRMRGMLVGDALRRRHILELFSCWRECANAVYAVGALLSAFEGVGVAVPVAALHRDLARQEVLYRKSLRGLVGYLNPVLLPRSLQKRFEERRALVFTKY